MAASSAGGDGLPGLVNPATRRMAADEPAIGMVVRLARSADIARIAKSSGHDFLFIDTQHALFSLETIGHIAQAALGCGVATLVRTRSCRDPDMALVLDCGASGVVVPDVNTAADAQAAVNSCKFTPIGRRSLLTGYAHFDYRPVPPAEAIRVLNDYTLVVCMIETAEGLANVEEIAAVEGVDVLLLGLTDLLADMGKPGALRDPEVARAVEKVAGAAKRNGKFFGVGGEPDPAYQAAFAAQGARFFTLQSDQALLMAAAGSAAAGLRAAVRGK